MLNNPNFGNIDEIKVRFFFNPNFFTQIYCSLRYLFHMNPKQPDLQKKRQDLLKSRAFHFSSNIKSRNDYLFSAQNNRYGKPSKKKKL